MLYLSPAISALRTEPLNICRWLGFHISLRGELLTVSHSLSSLLLYVHWSTDLWRGRERPSQRLAETAINQGSWQIQTWEVGMMRRLDRWQ
ncbi:hypothetical protein AB205_0124580 [Aquarana catesbeiana]|uniref:Uncharacterized protein n=1 Tax=Aquarana catesbeiana TaxID=8400 RepID=A0A2G9RAL7_AQUCT|nr:hypothetical protein AB205_0124580 [Aquarana catesbeiana]